MLFSNGLISNIIFVVSVCVCVYLLFYFFYLFVFVFLSFHEMPDTPKFCVSFLLSSCFFLFLFFFFFWFLSSPSQLLQVPTLGPRKHLYFNVIESEGGNKTLTVEGGGVNATVLQPNIAATNGIVHMIDRVLGVPFTTVQMKLATDPMLK